MIIININKVGRVSFGHSGFLPQFKDMKIRLIGIPKLPVVCE